MFVSRTDIKIMSFSKNEVVISWERTNVELCVDVCKTTSESMPLQHLAPLGRLLGVCVLRNSFFLFLLLSYFDYIRCIASFKRPSDLNPKCANGKPQTYNVKLWLEGGRKHGSKGLYCWTGLSCAKSFCNHAIISVTKRLSLTQQ